MKKSRVARGVVAGAAALSLGVLAACADDNGNGEGDGETINIGYLDWDEAVAVTYLWENILEDEGYTVELQQLEVGLIFEAMSNGEIDLFLDGWLPITHASLMEEYGDDLEEISVWYDNASLSIAVPTYVDEVDSLADLADNADLFGGEITGIDPGAGLTEATQDVVIPTYDLDGVMDLATSSTPAMLSALDGAIANEEPIVVTLWHPHWAYSTYDLKDLEDPEGTLADADEQLTILARDGFSDDFSEVTEMLERFEMDNDQLASLSELVINEYSGDEAGGVEHWLDDNPDYVDSVK